MMDRGIFAVIGQSLARLTEDLAVLADLCEGDERSARIGRQLFQVHARAAVEERMLRTRFDLRGNAPQSGESVVEGSRRPRQESERPTEIRRRMRSAQELSRSLEEQFRFFNLRHVARFFHKLRLDLYGYERSLVELLGPGEPVPAVDEEHVAGPEPQVHSRVTEALRECPLYFILDELIAENRDPLRIAFDAIGGGVRMMQLRLKRATSREVLDLARKLKPLCAESNCLLFINDRLDIALLSGADGVHVGDADVRAQDVRQLGHALSVGVTARTAQDALAAQSEGADYIGAGSVFASSTKPGLPVIGPRGISRISAAVDIPVVGIGGVTLANCRQVLAAGACGFCSVAPFATRRSIRNLVAEFRKQAWSADQPESRGNL